MFHGKQEVPVSTPFIKLDSFLKLAGACMTGGEAGMYIRDGQVSVCGAVCTQRGRKLYPGDEVCLNGTCFVVTRHAH